MKQLRMLLISIMMVSSFSGNPIIGFEPPAPAPKTEFEEQQEMAEELLCIIQKEEEKKLQQQEKKQMSAEDRAAQERKQKEKEVNRRKKAEENRAQMRQRAQNIFMFLLESHIAYKAVPIDYLPLITLEEIVPVLNQFEEDTAQQNKIMKQYSVGQYALNQIVADLKKELMLEIARRKKLSVQKEDREPSFKDLMVNSAIDLKRLSLKSLEAALNAIDRIINADGAIEFGQWAEEINTDLPQLGKILRDLKNRLRKTKTDLLLHIQEDLNKSEHEIKEEAAALKKSQEVAAKKIIEEPPAKVKEIQAKFQQFFENIPQEYQLAFLVNFEKRYAQGGNIDAVLSDLYKQEFSIIQSQRLLALAGALGFIDAFYVHGYAFFVHKKSLRKPPVLPGYLKMQEDINRKKSAQERKNLQAELARVAEELAQTYKIHLMPVDAIDQIKILLQMDKAIKTDPELSSLITVFKILVHPYRQGDVIFPKVVIYAFGKENTQRILNGIYQQFKDVPGLDLQPRYNAKVNDLIWVAQGDGDNKVDRYEAYYEMPGRVYYRPDITGKPQNYHLLHPETGKEII